MMKYQDATLTVEERVEDLLARMSLEQKIDQLSCFFFDGRGCPDMECMVPTGVGTVGAMALTDTAEELADIIEKVQQHIMEKTQWGIPALVHVEAITGGLFVEATSYPTAIAQASTWDPALLKEMTDCVRQQLLAVGYRHALSPVFDISRDPRWGRLTETYGEDETLAAAMGSAFVQGLQGDEPKESVAATAKHFVGHGLTEGGLNMAQNNITERELREVHCKPFQAAITEAGLMSVMNSYCNINREPIIGSKRILTDLLRGELGFDGLLVSDYVSIDRLLNPYQLADNYVDAGIMALEAGLDVEYPAPNGISYRLIDAVKEGKLKEAVIDRSVRRILSLKFRLGLFEHPFPQKEKIGSVFHDQKSEAVNRKMALEAITLLKNRNDVLPLTKEKKKIAVVGPHADRVRSLFGHYTYAAGIDMQEDAKNNCMDHENMVTGESGAAQGVGWYQRFPGEIRETPIYVEKLIREAYPQAKTLYQAVREHVPECEVVTAQGISYTGNNLAGYEQALQCAADADIVILTLGGQSGWGVVATNGEGIDNSNIDLPGKQEQFARDIRALGKQTVVVHIDGKPLSNEFVTSHFDGILEAWQLGQFGFECLAEVLFGDVSPAGRLPLTVARGADRLPVYYGAPRGSGYIGAGKFGVVSNRFGYINDTVHPLFYFGHGLSYSSFTYSALKLEQTQIAADGMLEFTVEVENVGKMDADEVVQVYLSDQKASLVRPDLQLIGFKRVHIKKGTKKRIWFRVQMSQLAFLDLDMNWKVEGGRMKLLVGASCIDIRLTTEFNILGDCFVDPKTRTFYAQSECLG